MDTITETPIPTTDLVIIDAEIVEEPSGFGSEFANNAITAAATSAVIVGGMLAYRYLKPKVTSLIFRMKTETEAKVEESPVTETTTPDPKKD